SPLSPGSNGHDSVVASAIDAGSPVITRPTELRRNVDSGGAVVSVSTTLAHGPMPVSKKTLVSPDTIACVNVMREPGVVGMLPKSNTDFVIPVVIVRVTLARPRNVPL